MHIHIEPEYLPEDGDEYEHCCDDCWRVWHGTWSFLAGVHWYTKSQNKTSVQHEHNSDWLFHSRVLLNPARDTPLGYYLASSCEEALSQMQQIILTGRYQQFKDSPKEFTLQKRRRVTEASKAMQFKLPEYPAWAIPIPVAVFGDPPSYRTRVGNVFCPISHEFAVEIFVEAWTQGSKPTNQELEIIHNLLTQHSVANH